MSSQTVPNYSFVQLVSIDGQYACVSYIPTSKTDTPLLTTTGDKNDPRTIFTMGDSAYGTNILGLGLNNKIKLYFNTTISGTNVPFYVSTQSLISNNIPASSTIDNSTQSYFWFFVGTDCSCSCNDGNCGSNSNCGSTGGVPATPLTFGSSYIVQNYGYYVNQNNSSFMKYNGAGDYLSIDTRNGGCVDILDNTQFQWLLTYYSPPVTSPIVSGQLVQIYNKKQSNMISSDLGALEAAYTFNVTYQLNVQPTVYDQNILYTNNFNRPLYQTTLFRINKVGGNDGDPIYIGTVFYMNQSFSTDNDYITTLNSNNNDVDSGLNDPDINTFDYTEWVFVDSNGNGNLNDENGVITTSPVLLNTYYAIQNYDKYNKDQKTTYLQTSSNNDLKGETNSGGNFPSNDDSYLFALYPINDLILPQIRSGDIINITCYLNNKINTPVILGTNGYTLSKIDQYDDPNYFGTVSCNMMIKKINPVLPKKSTAPSFYNRDDPDSGINCGDYLAIFIYAAPSGDTYTGPGYFPLSILATSTVSGVNDLVWNDCTTVIDSAYSCTGDLNGGSYFNVITFVSLDGDGNLNNDSPTQIPVLYGRNYFVQNFGKHSCNKDNAFWQYFLSEITNQLTGSMNVNVIAEDFPSESDNVNVGARDQFGGYTFQGLTIKGTADPEDITYNKDCDNASVGGTCGTNICVTPNCISGCAPISNLWSSYWWLIISAIVIGLIIFIVVFVLVISLLMKLL